MTRNADYAPVAQWIEQWSSKPRVGGSNPSRRANSVLVCISMTGKFIRNNLVFLKLHNLALSEKVALAESTTFTGESKHEFSKNTCS